MARAVSLVLAGAISLILLLYPFALGRSMTPATHSLLPILLLGVAGCFIHGLGFVPSARALRVLFGAPVAWTLVAGTSAALWLF